MPKFTIVRDRVQPHLEPAILAGKVTQQIFKEIAPGMEVVEVPDKPTWLVDLPAVLASVQQMDDTWVDRATIQEMLHIGRRRAQQLLAHLPTRRIGSSSVAHRDDLLHYLQYVSLGENASYEERRRKKFWGQIGAERQAWIEKPPVFIEIADRKLRQIDRNDFRGLPSGIELAPGKITISFETPEDALQKLLALAVAIGRNRIQFDHLVSK